MSAWCVHFLWPWIRHHCQYGGGNQPSVCTNDATTAATVRHWHLKRSKFMGAHLSMLSRTASTLWNNTLKLGRSLGSLLQHSVIILWICRRRHDKKNKTTMTYHSVQIQPFSVDTFDVYWPPLDSSQEQVTCSLVSASQQDGTRSSDLASHSPSCP